MTAAATAFAPVAQARAMQREWSRIPLRERLGRISAFRGKLVTQPMLDGFPAHRSRIETITAELMPLLDAACFLEEQAQRVLRTRRLPRRGGIAIELRREPLGVVLVIGPANYPLFLPGVQTLQALAAGNAVIWKPGRGGEHVAREFARRIDAPLLILDESVDAGRACIQAGVDRIVVTGSYETGKSVLQQAAASATPVIAELSGEDAAIVHRTANLDRAKRAIEWGIALNCGNTCIAPRRLIVDVKVAPEFRDSSLPMRTFRSVDEAVELANNSDYGLGACVFASHSVAKEIAARIRAGVVVINDVIVPTADPRLPFGGRGASGFGKTRGAEGLLEMTTLKALATQTRRRLRHLEALPANAEDLLLELVRARHAGRLNERCKGWLGFLKNALR